MELLAVGFFTDLFFGQRSQRVYSLFSGQVAFFFVYFPSLFPEVKDWLSHRSGPILQATHPLLLYCP